MLPEDEGENERLAFGREKLGRRREVREKRKTDEGRKKRRDANGKERKGEHSGGRKWSLLGKKTR